MQIHLKGWEDGEPVERTLDAPDRWAMHAADQVAVDFGDDLRVLVRQRPRDIPAARMGVGACLWEGELLLAAYLAAQPRHRYIGQRCVELGSGPGLAGLLLAALGARVAITDKASVLPLIRENIELNGLSDGSSSGGSGLGGSARAEELEWGSEGCAAAVTALSAPPGANDWVLAADVTYVDGDGASPDTAAFVEAARGLCGPETTVLVSFELRSSEVKAAFLAAAARQFTRVGRVPRTALPAGWRVDHIELYRLRP